MTMREVSKDEIIGIWLKREFEGNWEERIKPSVETYTPNLSEERIRSIVDNKNFQDNKENNLRFMLLYLFRSPLLLPCWNAHWYEKVLTEEEFKELRVIRDGYAWDVLSNLTGKISDAVENLYVKNKRTIPSIYGQLSLDYRKLVQAILKLEQSEKFDKNLILLQSDDSKYTTILEGNKTAVSLYTKYYFRKELKYESFRVFLGHLDIRSIWQW